MQLQILGQARKQQLHHRPATSTHLGELLLLLMLMLLLLLLYVNFVTVVIVRVVTITDAHTVALQEETCSFTSELGFHLGFHAKTRK